MFPESSHQPKLVEYSGSKTTFWQGTEVATGIVSKDPKKDLRLYLGP